MAAPHLDVSVFARGLLDRVVTRIYFRDEAEANAADPVLSSIVRRGAGAGRSSPLRKATGREGSVSTSGCRASGETVFFDVSPAPGECGSRPACRAGRGAGGRARGNFGQATRWAPARRCGTRSCLRWRGISGCCATSTAVTAVTARQARARRPRPGPVLHVRLPPASAWAERAAAVRRDGTASIAGQVVGVGHPVRAARGDQGSGAPGQRLGGRPGGGLAAGAPAGHPLVVIRPAAPRDRPHRPPGPAVVREWGSPARSGIPIVICMEPAAWCFILIDSHTGVSRQAGLTRASRREEKL